jgi:hypothetical protein
MAASLLMFKLVFAEPSAPPQDLLFMSPSDTLRPWGLQYPTATPVQPLLGIGVGGPD